VPADILPSSVAVMVFTILRPLKKIMINYDYICQNCDYKMHNVMQSIKDKPKKVCLNCGKHELERVLYGGAFCSVSKTPSTVGQLADRNAKKAGRQKMSEMEAQARKNQPSNSPPPKHLTATEREINKMSENQITRYIMEGKK